MEFDTDDHRLGRVNDYTYWVKLENYEDVLEPKTGVFIFANAAHQVRYVGKAEPGNMLTAVQSAMDSGNARQSTLVKAMYTGSSDSTKSLKSGMKTKYQPLNNDNVG